MRDTAYYILSFPLYGKFAFYGREYEAYDLLFRTEQREHESGKLWRADSGNPKDKELVRAEILATREDRLNGVEAPYLPKEGWLL